MATEVAVFELVNPELPELPPPQAVNADVNRR